MKEEKRHARQESEETRKSCVSTLRLDGMNREFTTRLRRKPIFWEMVVGDVGDVDGQAKLELVVLHDSPALARLVKRSPNELLCGTYCFIYLFIYLVMVSLQMLMRMPLTLLIYGHSRVVSLPSS